MFARIRWAALPLVALAVLGASVGRDSARASSAAVPGSWVSNFEGKGFDEWTSWRRNDGGDMRIVSPSAVGIPAHSGNKVAEFGVDAAQFASNHINSKLYKEWAVGWPETAAQDNNGRPLSRLARSGVSGTYRAWYFLPSTYSMGKGTWTNIFQFKEAYWGADGRWHEDPQWWLAMKPAGDFGSKRPAGTKDSQPVLVLSHWYLDGRQWQPRVAVPRGRWFELRADVYAGDHIDWFLDGKQFDRSYAKNARPHATRTTMDRSYPVGLTQGDVGWIFGVGHYGGIGKLWVDDVSFTPDAG